MINNSKLWQKDGFMPDMMNAVASPQQQSSFNPMALTPNQMAEDQQWSVTEAPSDQAQMTPEAQDPMANQRKALEQARIRYQQYLAQYGPDYPLVRQWQRRVNDLQAQVSMGGL